MGPKSKDAVCAVLGHILDELQQQRSVIQHELGQIRAIQQTKLESDAAGLAQVNRRVTELEKAFRGRFGGTPSPA